MSDNSRAEGLRVGIDLGTTNSLVAVVTPNGTVEILPSRDQERHTPSVVSLPKKVDPAHPDRYLVGRQAVHNARLAPANTIRSIKRFMGRRYDEPQIKIACEHVVYKTQADPGGSGSTVVKLGEKLLTPEEISALILRRLREDAESRLGGPVARAVITVPAYFMETQRVATRRAGELAGLQVMAILDEPTAAAIAEGQDRSENARILVFDFGGGTLDFSFIITSRGNMSVKCYGGDNFLGGDDIDRALANLIRSKIEDMGGKPDPTDLKFEVQLKANAEQAKMTLAAGEDVAHVDWEYACRGSAGEPINLELEITQAQFAQVMAPIEQRIKGRMEEFLKRENVEPSQITEVLMVGGSSAVKRVQELLRGMFEADGVKRVRLSRAPMEAVAMGAALYASRLRGLICKCGHENTLDATACAVCGEPLSLAKIVTSGPGVTSLLPRSLGVAYQSGESSDGYQAILKKGSLYPTDRVAETFRLPSKDRFRLRVFEGDEAQASRNNLQTVIVVDQIPPDVNKGDPIKVEFSYTRDRTLFITLGFPTSKTGFEPRWKLAPPDGGPEKPDDPVGLLAEFLPQARSFATDYDKFLKPGPRRTLGELLNRAQEAVLSQDRKETGAVQGLITKTMLHGCGVASTLFLAERTVANEDKEFGRLITEGAAKLREQFEANSPEVEATRGPLEKMCMEVLGRRVHAPSADGDLGPEDPWK
jgi:molecular chaperone DnaK